MMLPASILASPAREGPGLFHLGPEWLRLELCKKIDTTGVREFCCILTPQKTMITGQK